ncbi:MAG: ABC transporter permease [Acidobacteria bacterium]|nr:MAG: ABC transporter permease [Acidobacteriota bacterium]
MVITILEKTGSAFLGFVEEVGAFSQLVKNTLFGCFRRPFEFRELVKQLEKVGVQSSSVVLVTAIFTGMVFCLQIYGGFQRFQAEGYVPTVLGLALLRELIPVLCGLMVAGRVGSAMAAELGTMKVSDQIDALEVMSTSPVQYLVVPRFLALTFMLPLLIALGDFIGLLGGQFLVNHILHDPFPGFMERVFDYLDAEDFWSGLVKASVFGAIIALVGCFHGLNTRGGAEGVGRSTTTAVVKASLGILIADFFLSKLFY